MPTYYIYEKEGSLYYARDYSDARLTGRYNEIQTQDENIFSDFKNYIYQNSQFVYVKPDSLVNQEKKTEHLQSYAAILTNSGYTGDLESISEIDSYIVSRYNAAQDNSTKIDIVFIAVRVIGYFVASIFRGNYKK